MTWEVGDTVFWSDSSGVWQGTVLDLYRLEVDTSVAVRRDTLAVDFGVKPPFSVILWGAGELHGTLDAALRAEVRRLQDVIPSVQRSALDTDDEVTLAALDYVVERARWKLERVLSALEG